MASDESADWGAWSREAVALMQRRNEGWAKTFGLTDGAPFQWSLEEGKIFFMRGHDRVAADLCLIGTASTSGGTFMWAWANDAIPLAARRGLEAVNAFGQKHGLSPLVEAEWPAGRAEGLEMLAVASRVLDAEGCWVDNSGDLTLFFALRNFRAEVDR